MELVKITTAGSVDNGKSTLIGRLLHDCNLILDDQLASVEKASKQKNLNLDLSLLTDGLAAEREQGITIDVAYRYFSTPKRRFILADVPGHEQYTRNMVTGASNANLAIILIDAQKGVSMQSKRHLFISSLLGIPHIAIIINKMDAVNYEEKIFEDIKKTINNFAEKLEVKDLQFIPVSALKGDMVVYRHDNMPWYGGRTVLDYLENIQVSSDKNLIDLRLPIQYVLRNEKGQRYYAGKIESGVLKKNDKIIILPSLKTTKIKTLISGGEKTTTANAAESVVVEFTDDIDASRGDMLARENNLPDIANEFESIICWMDSSALKEDKSYLFKHTTKTTRGYIQKLHHLINIDTLHREATTELNLNEIGRVNIKLLEPFMFDMYSRNRDTGSFIVIDENSNNTVGAGIILRKSQKIDFLNYQERNFIQNKGGVLWFTGLSGAGKTTLADKLHKVLTTNNILAERLDGDIMREVLCKDLGFSKKDRETNIERAGFVAQLLAKNNILVLASFISPYKAQREKFKKEIPNFVEIFVNTPLEICEKRDIKGLYKKARSGEVKNFTGISHDYEKPTKPDIQIDTTQLSEERAVEKIIEYLIQNGYIRNYQA